MALRDLLASFRIRVQTGALKQADVLLAQSKVRSKALGASFVGLRGQAQGALGLARVRLKQLNVHLNNARRRVLALGQAFNAAGANTLKWLSGLANVRNALLGLGVVVAAQQIAGFFQGALDAADATAKLSARLGLNIKELQTFEGFAVTAGSSARGMATALRTLAKNAEDFRTGAGEAKDAFEGLGIAVEGSNGQLKPLGELTTEALKSLADLEDQTQKVAFAQRLFGRSGTELLPNLRGGSKAVEENLQRARELAVIYDEGAGSIEAANDEIYFFTRQTQGLKYEFVRSFLPAIRKGVFHLTMIAKATREWAKVNQTSIQSGLKSLGIGGFLMLLHGIVGRFGGIRGAIRVLMPWVNRLFFGFLKFAIPFLLIEDFFGFLEGKKSVIGSVLEELEIVDDAVDAGKEFKKVLVAWIPTFKRVAKDAGIFFKQTIQGFGLLTAMATTSNAAVRDDFSEKFIQNTNTIGAFFDWVASYLPSGLITPFQMGLYWVTELFVQMVAGSANVIGRLHQIIGSTFTSALQTAGAAVAWFVSWIDVLFGTNLAESVNSATGNVVAGFNDAWSQAAQGLETLENSIRNTGATIKKLITDPLGGVAELLSGQSEGQVRQNIQEINRMNKEAATRRAEARGGSTRVVNVTNAPSTTVNVTAQPGASPGQVGRQVGSVVSSVYVRSNRATLAAVR